MLYQLSSVFSRSSSASNGCAADVTPVTALPKRHASKRSKPKNRPPPFDDCDTSRSTGTPPTPSRRSRPLRSTSLALAILLSGSTTRAADLVPDLPPIPKTLSRAIENADGTVTLEPDAQLFLRNFAARAYAMPAQCRRIIEGERLKHQASIVEFATSCAAETQAIAAAAEAAGRESGVHPVTVAIVTIITGVVAFGLGAVTVVFSK